MAGLNEYLISLLSALIPLVCRSGGEKDVIQCLFRFSKIIHFSHEPGERLYLQCI